MEKKVISNFIESESVKMFAQTVVQYCLFIDNIEVMSKSELLKKAHELLSLLYYQALLLPDVSVANDALGKDRMSYEEWSNIYKTLQLKLNGCDYYWDVFNPTDQQNEEAICSSLADDLADIYRDLKAGLDLWNKGTLDKRQDAIWEWKFKFWSHTGQHINGALRAIFWWLSETIDEDMVENL